MVKNLKISIFTILVLTLLLVLHLWGMAEHLYVEYWFYDIILHFLGGAGVAVSILCISKLLNIPLIKSNMINIIYLTFIAGVAWELFELYYDIAGHVFGTFEYNSDTVKDLIMDSLGGAAIVLIYRKK